MREEDGGEFMLRPRVLVGAAILEAGLPGSRHFGGGAVAENSVTVLKGCQRV